MRKIMLVAAVAVLALAGCSSGTEPAGSSSTTEDRACATHEIRSGNNCITTTTEPELPADLATADAAVAETVDALLAEDRTAFSRCRALARSLMSLGGYDGLDELTLRVGMRCTAEHLAAEGVGGVRVEGSAAVVVADAWATFLALNGLRAA